MKTKELVVKKEEVLSVINPFEARAIVSKDDMTEATSALSKLNKYADALKKDKELITKPINQALKEIREKYKPMEALLEDSIAVIKSKMSAYQQKALEEQRKQEAKIAEQLANGKIKKVETAIKKIGAIDAPEEKIKTEDGGVSFRAVKCFEVMDITMLPIEYHLPDESAIRKAMQAGVELAGVQYYEEQQIINRRN